MPDQRLLTAARRPSAEQATAAGFWPHACSASTLPSARSTRETESAVWLAVKRPAARQDHHVDGAAVRLDAGSGAARSSRSSPQSDRYPGRAPTRATAISCAVSPFVDPASRPGIPSIVTRQGGTYDRILPVTTMCWPRWHRGDPGLGDHDAVHPGDRRPGRRVDVVEVVQQADHVAAAAPAGRSRSAIRNGRRRARR